MSNPRDLRAAAFAYGRAKKRNNAIVALLAGGLPGIILSSYFPTAWSRWLTGLFIGLIWANGFEYAYHRWLLHKPRSKFAAGHRIHHSTLGEPEEPEHVTLGSSPLNIAVLFASNGVLLYAVDWLLKLRITSGVVLGWTVYLILAEEIHWRIHMGDWLPPGLHFAREYHFRHHDTPNTRYNVFLPLFDWVLGNMGEERLATPFSPTRKL